MGILKKFRANKMRCDYKADCLAVRNKSLDFLTEPNFVRAWDSSQKTASHGWEKLPDIRWRTHIAIWAAQHGLNLEGDFVECGVYTGILSLAICEYTQFQNVNKKFYLYDLWDSIPLESVNQNERETVKKHNDSLYSNHNVFESTREAFSSFPNCHLIKGFLPETLSVCPEKIAYLSIDLNNAPAEKACIEKLWPKLTSGALVVLDDYGWNGHEEQRHMWDAFTRQQNVSIATLPTGQGLIIKP